MKSIVQQLALRNGLLLNELKELYGKHSRPKTTPVLAECRQLLLSAVSCLPKTYVVIDALDQCAGATRDILPTELRRLEPKICLFITSRHTFSGLCDPENDVQLELHANETDIKPYLDERIKTSKVLQDYIDRDESFRDKITSGILAKAQGM